VNRRVRSELIHIRTQINSKWRLSGATIAQGGILPKIQSILLPKKVDEPAKKE